LILLLLGVCVVRERNSLVLAVHVVVLDWNIRRIAQLVLYRQSCCSFRRWTCWSVGSASCGSGSISSCNWWIPSISSLVKLIFTWVIYIQHLHIILKSLRVSHQKFIWPSLVVNWLVKILTRLLVLRTVLHLLLLIGWKISWRIIMHGLENVLVLLRVVIVVLKAKTAVAASGVVARAKLVKRFRLRSHDILRILRSRNQKWGRLHLGNVIDTNFLSLKLIWWHLITSWRNLLSFED